MPDRIEEFIVGRNLDAIYERLVSIVGRESVSRDEVDLVAYSKDWIFDSATTSHMPDLVVRPDTTMQVAEIVRLANMEKIPVVPWGGGTGVHGQAIAVRGGIIIDMKAMNRVLEIEKDDWIAKLQPGITILKLNQELSKHGFWFPHDPESKPISTVGGAISVDGVSTFGSRYGGAVEWVLGLTVVLPTGEIVKLGSKAYAQSAGYKLHWLFIGAEGTLGIITEATVRIFPLPKVRVIDIILYEDIAKAVKAALKILEAGLAPEEIWITCHRRFAVYAKEYEEKYGKSVGGIPKDVGAALCIGFAGWPEVVNVQREIMLKISGGTPIEDRALVEAWWFSKYLVHESATWSTLSLKKKYASVYPSVPYSRIRDLYELYIRLARKYKLEIFGLGILTKRPGFSPGLSCGVYFNDRDPDEVKRLGKFRKEVAQAGKDFGGVVEAWSGCGLLFKELCRYQNDSTTLELMRSIKALLDPNNILNPGKLFPE